MKATEIKKLLAKDKRTVDEVGKLFLALTLSQKIGEDLPVEFLSYDLIEQLEREEKEEFFDKYSGVPPFISSMLKDYESVIKSFASILMRYEGHITTFEDAEHAYIGLSLQPRILTKTTYEEILKEARAEIELSNFSLIGLITAELGTQLRKHHSGEDTPYSANFEKLKKKISAKHRCLYAETIKREFYKHYDDYELTEDSTYYEVLKNIPYIFHSSHNYLEDVNLSSLFEICPELIKAIADNYSQLNGLEYIKELTLSDYADPNQAIPFKTAYNLNLLGAKQNYDSPTLCYKGQLLLHGAAVIEGNLIPIAQVKNDTYYYTLSATIKHNMAEGILKDESKKKEILRLKKFLKMAGKILNAHAYTLDLMAEVTGLKDYKKLKKNHMDADLEGLIVHAANSQEIIDRMGFLEDEGNTDDLQKQVKDTFDLKFKLKDIRFSAKEKAEAKKRYNEYEGEGLEDKINEALIYLKECANT
jgi:hypothetical protein